MCRITTAAQSPFVDYNPMDILMGIKKGGKKQEWSEMNIVALTILRQGNLSQLLKLGVLRINLLASASCSLRIQSTVLAILLIHFWRLRIRFEKAYF